MSPTFWTPPNLTPNSPKDLNAHLHAFIREMYTPGHCPEKASPNKPAISRGQTGNVWPRSHWSVRFCATLRGPRHKAPRGMRTCVHPMCSSEETSDESLFDQHEGLKTEGTRGSEGFKQKRWQGIKTHKYRIASFKWEKNNSWESWKGKKKWSLDQEKLKPEGEIVKKL